MATSNDVVNVARRMVGTRWRHQGRAPGIGLDCVGVVVCTGRELGVLDYDLREYPRHAAVNGFMDYFRAHGNEIALRKVHPGAVLALQEKTFPCHCGIVASDVHGLTLIHAYAPRRRVVEERLTPEWWAKVLAVFEFRGVGA